MAATEKMARKRPACNTSEADSDSSETEAQKRRKSDESQEEYEIQAVTKFDQALKKYHDNFESEIVALDFLVGNGPSDQLASFLNLIRQQSIYQHDQKRPVSLEKDCNKTQEILASVFRRVEVPGLKILRQVSKLWCTLATPFMNAKTVLTSKCIQRTGIEEEVKHQGSANLSLSSMMLTWTGKTHRFRYVELDLSREYWCHATGSLRNTMQSLFLNSSMFTVETLKIRGYRVDLFDQQYVTSIPSCFGRFWKKLKSVTFLKPFVYHENGTEQILQKVEEWRSDSIVALEEIHFEVDCDRAIDWTFLETCSKLKAIEVISPFSPFTEPGHKCIFEQLLENIQGKEIEKLALEFTAEDEEDLSAIINFVVALGNNLKDVVYRIFGNEGKCLELELIKSAPLPLKSAKFVLKESEQGAALRIWEALGFAGYLDLEMFELSIHHKSVRKIQDQVIVSENGTEILLDVPKDSKDDGTGKQDFFASLGKKHFEHAAEDLQLYESLDEDEADSNEVSCSKIKTECITNESCCSTASISEVDKSDLVQSSEMDRELIGGLEAVSEFCNAIAEYKSQFTSEETAAIRLVRMKDSVWPSLSAFIWSCWSSKLYDREDWRVNPVVMDAVCDKLDTSDLKVMRLVCKDWLYAVSPKLAKKTMTTCRKKFYVPVSDRERGVKVQTSGNQISPVLLDSTVTTSIRLRHLEINCYELDWENDLEMITESLFMNSTTSALETLRIFGFHPVIMDRQFLPNLIPKHLKELKSLTLLWPLPLKGETISMSEPCNDKTKLEKLTVNIYGNWRPSWKFLEFCPNLKCFKLLGRNILPTSHKHNEYVPVVPWNFVKCLQDVRPFLETKAIQKLGLKFRDNQTQRYIGYIAGFVNAIIAKGTLQDVTYEVDAVPRSVSQLLTLLSLPSRRAKIVVDMVAREYFRRPDPNFSALILSVYDRIQSKGYFKLDRLDCRFVTYSLQIGEPEQRLQCSLLVDGNSVVFRKLDSLVLMGELSLRRCIRRRFSLWFPDMNYLCYPQQFVSTDGSKFTKLLEMAVFEGNAFHLPGVPRGKRGEFEVFRENPGTCAKIQDASIIHQNAVNVPKTIRSRDLYDQECQIYIFGRVQLDEFERVKNQTYEEESGIENMSIQDWNLPESLAMLREIQTHPNNHMSNTT